MAPRARSKFGAPMFEPEVFRKQMFCIEESICDICVTFRRPPHQLRTQKIFMGGFWFRVIWWPFVFGVRSLWRHNLTSFTCFQTNVLAKFVDIVCTFFYIRTSYFMCHCTEYKLWALQGRLPEKNNINATTQQFISAKISGWALKQGSETRSSLRQSNLQLQNEAALRSRQILAVEHWRCAAGLAGADPGLRDRILINYTRIENARKVHKKTLVFCDL